MKILEFFYRSWNTIIIMSSIIGLLAVFIPFNKLIANESRSKLIKVLKYLFASMAVIFIIIAGVIHSIFTEVPEVRGIDVSSAIKYLRENNLEGQVSYNWELL